MSWLSFLFGLCVGSFLNVCIHRLPQGASVVRPRSRCPNCNSPIAAYDNIPLLSFALLRGRCRRCRAVISPLYPTVELLTGLVFLLVYFRFGVTPAGLKATLLASALVVLVFTDLRERLLPDLVTFPGMAAGALLALWVPVGDGTAAALLRLAGVFDPHAVVASLGDAALGALVGGGLLYLVGEAYLWWRKRPGMGFGDVKMMTMVGAFLGLKLTILVILLASLVGSVGAIPLIAISYVRAWADPRVARMRSRLTAPGKKPMSRARWAVIKAMRTQVPFGVFLGLASLVGLFWGELLIRAYVSLLE